MFVVLCWNGRTRGIHSCQFTNNTVEKIKVVYVMYGR